MTYELEIIMHAVVHFFIPSQNSEKEKLAHFPVLSKGDN